MFPADLVQWLSDLGLAQYAQAFRDNDIDDAVTLRQLTEADLAELGVKSVGHRRKLAHAIAALSTQPAALLAARRPAPANLAAPVVAEAELRLLTVLYCEMLTAGGDSRADPEALRQAIQVFHETCTQLVAEYDGHVANFYGDCMLAYFGWPRAHEDDAERAVRAGLGMVRRVRAQEAASAATIGARAGIATGPVVVGDLIHKGPAQQQSAVGLAPNLGARVRDLARPGQVVIDEQTRQLVLQNFALRSLGSHTFAGIDQAVSVYAVSGERMCESRFDARRARGHALAPMVGRDQELALLMERWLQACGGEGAAVMLVGEAGIGKSRIARALLDAGTDQPRWVVHWQCSPYRTGSPLWPVIQRLAREARVQPHDTSEAALDKLEAVAGSRTDIKALYATMLGLNGAQRYGPLEMAPQMLRERTLELLIERLVEMADERPLLLVVEDAHWIDPTTLELIERCLQQLERARILVLITSRSDHSPALAAHPSVTRLSLNRLGRASAEAIAARLAGASLQTSTLASIVAQADGVPLFVEELTKAVLENGEATIPASLHGSLMARLDRVPAVKEIAQTAACIGREFEQALLQQVAERPPQAVTEALEQLVAAELVFQRGGRVNPRFVFKHALLQEAAYESLLRSRRQAIHARLVRALEGEAQTPHEMLAHHAERAGETNKAIDHWGRAGNAALADSAYAEATDYLQRAIRLIGDQTDRLDRGGQELELQAQLGLCYMGFHGSSSELTRRAYTRAHELLDADPQSGAPLRQRVHYGLWASRFDRNDLTGASHLAAAALAAEQTHGTAESAQFAHRLLATSLAVLGDLGSAQSHFEAAMPLTDSARRAELSAHFGFDPGIATLYYYAWASAVQGRLEQSDELAARAQSLCAGQTQVFTRAHTCLLLALRAACLDDGAAVAREAEALADLGARHGLSRYEGYVDVLRTWQALGQEAPTDETIATCRRGIGRLEALATRVWIPLFMGRLATGLAAAGRDDEALETIDHALAQCKEAPQAWCTAELWRVHGVLAHDRADALRSLERAEGLARAHGAKLWELRVEASLAELRLRGA